MPKIEKQVDK